MLTFALFWLTLLLAKGTPVGRFMHRWMVEKPAALCSRIGTGGFLTLCMVVVWLIFRTGYRLKS